MTVTAILLKAAGYQVASTVEQTLIDRCVSDILTAYIAPIWVDYTDDDADVVKAVYCLTYLLLLDRTAIRTQYGARQKNVDQSQVISERERNSITITADMFLEILKTKEDAETDPTIYDIARVYNFNSLT